MFSLPKMKNLFKFVTYLKHVFVSNISLLSFFHVFENLMKEPFWFKSCPLRRTLKGSQGTKKFQK